MRNLALLVAGVVLFAAGLALGVVLQARNPIISTRPEGKAHDRSGAATLALLPLRYKNQREGQDPRFILDYLRGGVAARLQGGRVGLLSLAEADRKLGAGKGQSDILPRQAGNELSVEYVLAGSVTEGSALVLDVELVESTSGRVVWSGRYGLDRSLGDFEKSADKAVGEIAEQVDAKLGAER